MRYDALSLRVHFAASPPSVQEMTAEKPVAAPDVASRASTMSPLCTEDEIVQLVREFYARVRTDELLGPIFNSHVADWGQHLSTLVDFWSSVLLRTRRFRGTPMPKHVAIPDLNGDLFRRWLALFRSTASEQANQAMADQACAMAERIAQSLWMGYQLSRSRDAMPSALELDGLTVSAPES